MSESVSESVSERVSEWTTNLDKNRCLLPHLDHQVAGLHGDVLEVETDWVGEPLGFGCSVWRSGESKVRIRVRVSCLALG